jgi:MFS family permease
MDRFLMHQNNNRLGPVQLINGVTRANALSFLYAAFIGITLNTFVNFIMPYVLTEQLHIPVSDQGRITGNLVFYSEMLLLLVCGVAGIIADRWGRRLVFIGGFFILTAGFMFYGFVDNYTELLLLRLFLAIGVACINVMVTTVQSDYPVEASRGKLAGMTGFSIGLGALLLVFVLSKMPAWYSTIADARSAGIYSLLTTAAIAFLSALLLTAGLSPVNPSSPDAHQQKHWKSQLRESLEAARANPTIGLAYACAFVARGDLIVVGVFFSLWMTQTGIANGMDTAEAIKTAGMYFGIIQAAALVSAPLLGWMNDKLERLKALAVSLLIAAAGYGSLGFIDNPLGPWMLPAALLLGVGQMSVMLASQTLIGQEADIKNRGSVIGMFSVCGALGIMFITKLGGATFDLWKPSPFVIVAALNSLLFIWALRLQKHKKNQGT